MSSSAESLTTATPPSKKRRVDGSEAEEVANNNATAAATKNGIPKTAAGAKNGNSISSGQADAASNMNSSNGKSANGDTNGASAPAPEGKDFTLFIDTISLSFAKPRTFSNFICFFQNKPKIDKSGTNRTKFLNLAFKVDSKWI